MKNIIIRIKQIIDYLFKVVRGLYDDRGNLLMILSLVMIFAVCIKYLAIKACYISHFLGNVILYAYPIILPLMMKLALYIDEKYLEEKSYAHTFMRRELIVLSIIFYYFMKETISGKL